MATVNQVLGQCVCPLCRSAVKQEVKLSEKSGKPYLNCEECGMQLFARQHVSVKILRAMVSEGVVEPEKPTQKPTPTPRPVAQPAQVVEKTIFDIFS